MPYKLNNIWSFSVSFDLNKNGPLEPGSFSKEIKLQKPYD